MYYSAADLALGAAMTSGFLAGTLVAALTIERSRLFTVSKLLPASVDSVCAADEQRLSESANHDIRAGAFEGRVGKKKTWLALFLFWLVTAISLILVALPSFFLLRQCPEFVLNLFDYSTGEPNAFRFGLLVLAYNVFTLWFLFRHFNVAGLIFSFMIANSTWWLIHSYMAGIMQGFR